jgi:hypothetical protein
MLNVKLKRRDCVGIAASAHYDGERRLREIQAHRFFWRRLSKALIRVSIKTIAIIAGVLVVVSAAGWFFRDAPAVRETAETVSAFAQNIVPDNSYTVAKAENDKAAGRIDKAGAAGPLRKCVSDGRTIYTDEKCPSGSREAPISEGNVTVMPSTRPAAKPKAEEKTKSEEKTK